MKTHSTPLLELSTITASLRSGSLSLDTYLNQLEQATKARDPGLHAFVGDGPNFRNVRAAAEELLGRFPSRSSRPALFGVPIGVKDIFHVDGLSTRAGSRLPAEELAGSQAEAVTLLEAAGALVLGKTATTEFAYFGPAKTKNPHDPAHTPGGSSSGSAAAVAAGLCPLALGTQTIGSISRPASFCGVVGFKPTYDRISRAGVIPLAPSLDHIGFFTPDVAGAERVAAVLCVDWEPFDGERRPVLGISGGPYLRCAEAEGRKFFRRVCKQLGEIGFEVCRVEVMDDFQGIQLRHRAIVAAEAARVHADWYRRFRDLYHSKTVELIEEGLKISDAELETALTGRESLRTELEAVREDHGIDLWISPAAPGPAPLGLESTGDPVMNLPWTHSGLPTLAIPVPEPDAKLPMGLQLAAGWMKDEELFAWARAVEDALQGATTKV